jgi:RNA polymerase sigma-70 factor (ECF subfamily)
MSDLQVEFTLLMERVRAGSPEAARELFDRYSGHVRRVVRRKLHQRLRPQYDSLDFLQAVWASFFAESLERYTFTAPEELIGFLSQLAYNKVVDAFRQRVQTAKHNLNRTYSLEREDGRSLDPECSADDLSVRQPTPSQVAIANERWERLLQGQPPQYRQILELLRQGHTHREIADRLGLHPKTIQRLLQKLTQRVDLQ